MKIEVTEIVDSVPMGTDFGSRLLLADKIIEQFTPLFSDEIDRQRQQLNDNRSDISKLKKDVAKYKRDLQLINEAVKKETIITEILTEMDYLNNNGVLYGQTKQVVKTILSTMSDQSIEGLGENLKVLKRLVRTNVNKVM